MRRDQKLLKDKYLLKISNMAESWVWCLLISISTVFEATFWYFSICRYRAQNKTWKSQCLVFKFSFSNFEISFCACVIFILVEDGVIFLLLFLWFLWFPRCPRFWHGQRLLVDFSALLYCRLINLPFSLVLILMHWI